VTGTHAPEHSAIGSDIPTGAGALGASTIVPASEEAALAVANDAGLPVAFYTIKAPDHHMCRRPTI